MFSALKKWAKGGNEDSKINTPLGVRAMGQALQRKFARGVQYNSKLCRLKSYVVKKVTHLPLFVYFY